MRRIEKSLRTTALNNSKIGHFKQKIIDFCTKRKERKDVSAFFSVLENTLLDNENFYSVSLILNLFCVLC